MWIIDKDLIEEWMLEHFCELFMDSICFQKLQSSDKDTVEY